MYNIFNFFCALHYDSVIVAMKRSVKFVDFAKRSVCLMPYKSGLFCACNAKG